MNLWRSNLAAAGFGFWVAIGLALAACSRHSSPEAEIRELIERAATAAEERNVRDLRALIADDYADERGLDRKAVENLLRLHVLRQQSIHLFVRVRGIEFPEPERALVSVAADSPFLPGDLVARLTSARAAQGARLAVAASGGHTHPVIGLWPVDLRADLRRALVDEDIRKIDRFTARYAIATVAWGTAPVDPFFNANTPEELAQAELLAASLR
jgi:hypothetical protein